MARIDELRLLTRIARLYYEDKLSQADIAAHLKLTQSKVSRMLKRAQEEGIVRTTVSIPAKVHTELEDQIRERYGVPEVIVADCLGDSEPEILRAIGAAAAYYLESTLDKGEVIGLSSWSATLLSMVNALHPIRKVQGTRVVQILGGVGSPAAEAHASHLIKRFSDLVGGTPVMLPAPGVAPSHAARKAFEADQFVREAYAAFNQITLALVGVGATAPSDLLTRSGNTFSSDELELLTRKGAVGDICLRFFDKDGGLVPSALDNRVLAMTFPQLSAVKRVVGVAGGARKAEALRGVLIGKLVNVLITDRFTAERLLVQ